MRDIHLFYFLLQLLHLCGISVIYQLLTTLIDPTTTACFCFLTSLFNAS